MGDLFAPVLELKQRLPDLKKLAEPAAAEPISLAAQVEDELVSQRRRGARASKKAVKPPAARKARRKV
jgi:hypothetical protein